MIEIIKVTTKEELEQSLNIRKKVFVEEKGVDIAIEHDDYDSLDGVAEHFLITYDNNGIGAFRIVHENEETIKLQRFCLLKSWRGLGHGKSAIFLLERFYKQLGVKFVKLSSKYDMAAFYLSCGYKAASEEYIEAGIKHILMVKYL